MNAADYLARAEQLLTLAAEQADDGYVHEEANLIARALTAAVMAVAVELGVPPVPAPAGGGSGG